MPCSARLWSRFLTSLIGPFSPSHNYSAACSRRKGDRCRRASPSLARTCDGLSWRGCTRSRVSGRPPSTARCPGRGSTRSRRREDSPARLRPQVRWPSLGEAVKLQGRRSSRSSSTRMATSRTLSSSAGGRRSSATCSATSWSSATCRESPLTRTLSACRR